MVIHYHYDGAPACGVRGVSCDEPKEVDCPTCVAWLTVPMGEWPLHQESEECWCAPTVIREGGRIITVHNTQAEAH